MLKPNKVPVVVDLLAMDMLSSTWLAMVNSGAIPKSWMTDFVRIHHRGHYEEISSGPAFHQNMVEAVQFIQMKASLLMWVMDEQKEKQHLVLPPRLVDPLMKAGWEAKVVPGKDLSFMWIGPRDERFQGPSRTSVPCEVLIEAISNDDYPPDDLRLLKGFADL